MKTKSNMSRRYPGPVTYALQNGRPRKDKPHVRGPHLRGKALRVVAFGEGYDRFMTVVCERMRDSRLEQQISVAELAAACGTDESTIHRYEAINWQERKRHRWPSIKRIVQIAAALGVMPIDFIPDEH